MANIQGKVWGQTSPIFNRNNVEIHRLEINKGGTCSKHYHLHKHNMFFVESGKIEVCIWQKDYDLTDKTILTDTQSSIIKPGLFHQFKAIEDSIVYEIYYTCLESEDIIRETVGYSDEDSSFI